MIKLISNTMKKETIYIGGGFIEQQYPYLLPIIFKYCEVSGVKNIVFELRPGHKFYSSKYYKNNLKKYNILSQSQVLPFYFKNKFVRFLFILPLAITKVFKINRKSILKKKNYFQMEFEHSVWDTSLNISKSYLKPNLFIRLISTIKSLDAILLAKILKKLNLHSIFLNHSVYFYRAMLSEFRRDKEIKLFGQADFNVHQHERFADSNQTMLKKEFINHLKKNISFREIKDYWVKRSNGQSIYETANDAFKKIKKVKNFMLPKNILMLHVFRDSSYGYLDKKRIFVDYSDWLKFTLKHISESDEDWGIKFHPIAKRWGEDSLKIFNEFIDEIFDGNLPKNLILINNEVSNYKIMRSCNRLVTFWGTCHVESACYGLKPITIRETQLSYFDKDLVFKPNSLNQYSKLLKTKKIKIFKLNKDQKIKSQYLIYLREKVLNFIFDVGQHSITRGDSKRYINKNLKKGIKNINIYKDFLENNGKILKSKFTHTVSKKFTNIVLERYYD